MGIEGALASVCALPLLNSGLFCLLSKLEFIIPHNGVVSSTPVILKPTPLISVTVSANQVAPSADFGDIPSSTGL